MSKREHNELSRDMALAFSKAVLFIATKDERASFARDSKFKILFDVADDYLVALDGFEIMYWCFIYREYQLDNNLKQFFNELVTIGKPHLLAIKANYIAKLNEVFNGGI